MNQKKLRYISKPKLARICQILNCFITQDKDGFIQIWDSKPSKNLNNGYWEIQNYDSLFIKSLCLPYTDKWDKSLITPWTYKGYER